MRCAFRSKPNTDSTGKPNTLRLNKQVPEGVDHVVEHPTWLSGARVRVTALRIPNRRDPPAAVRHASEGERDLHGAVRSRRQAAGAGDGNGPRGWAPPRRARNQCSAWAESAGDVCSRTWPVFNVNPGRLVRRRLFAETHSG